jgi:peptidoglycan hydrolase CwlO-like protein
MSVSEQVDALQKRAADLKSSADQARHETNEQIKARIDKTRADIVARPDAVKAKAGQAADQAQGQWKSPTLSITPCGSSTRRNWPSLTQ